MWTKLLNAIFAQGVVCSLIFFSLPPMDIIHLTLFRVQQY